MRIDVAGHAELPGGAQLPQRDQRRVVGEQVADHQGPAALVGERDEALGRGDVAGQRLLDEAVLAGLALEAGKHCFVEKPLACDVASAERLVALADERGRTLMVGHLLAYHPALVALRELCAAGELGVARYIYSHRLNLGRLRADENALWSLGAQPTQVEPLRID